MYKQSTSGRADKVVIDRLKMAEDDRGLVINTMERYAFIDDTISITSVMGPGTHRPE